MILPERGIHNILKCDWKFRFYEEAMFLLLTCTPLIQERYKNTMVSCLSVTFVHRVEVVRAIFRNKSKSVTPRKQLVARLVNLFTSSESRSSRSCLQFKSHSNCVFLNCNLTQLPTSLMRK